MMGRKSSLLALSSPGEGTPENKGRNHCLVDAEHMAGMPPGLYIDYVRLGKALNTHSFNCAFKERSWSIWPSARKSERRKCLCA